MADFPALVPFSSPDLVRQAPHNIEAEQALLGAILVNNKAYERVSDFLKPEHFYDPSHLRIFSAATTLIERGQIANPITLKNYFDQDASLTPVGGAAYLVTLASSTVSIINAEDYGRAIYDLYLRRQLIDIGEDMVNTAYTSDIDSPALEQLQETEQKLFDLATVGEVQGGFVKFDKSLAVALQVAETAHKMGGGLTGVTSGLRDLDRKMGGLHPSDLIILAARPSMGKTSLACNIAYNAAKAYLDRGGKPGAAVAFFSLEMSADQLATRLLADESRVPGDRIRRGDIQTEDFTKFLEASKVLSRVPLYIDDTPALSIANVRMRSRRLKRLVPSLGLIIIDYLQLLRGSSNKGSENRVQEVSEITRGLKAIAKELHVPVIALSQLSRAVESREDKRPQLSDLRESGSIEQDADVVMFIYREEYYLSRQEPARRPDEDDMKYNDRHARWQEACEHAYGIAEVILAKQRHGPIGTIKMAFDGAFTRFSDLDQVHDQGMME
jgi:replicative DNA helicase